MKVIIATSIDPFVPGGATYIVESLEAALKQRGHQVDTLQFPYAAAGEPLAQMMAMRLIDMTQSGDRLIAIRAPSHLLRHPNKVVWFIHHFRGVYDLWGTRYQTVPNTPEGDATRAAIIAADTAGLKEATKLFSNSEVVKERLARFNNVQAEVLYPPLLNPERYHAAGYEDFLLYVSRLAHHKRQWLAIESLRYTKTPVKVVIAGAPDPDSVAYANELQHLVKKYKLSDRVTIIPRWIGEDEKLDLYARCRAVLYFPFDEDSYGYPSLEAHHSSKAVLTTTDSGGTRELIEDGQNGFLLPPDPQLIAEAMDALHADAGRARDMGAKGKARVAELGISWDRVADRLLS